MYSDRELGRAVIIDTADVPPSDFLYTVERIREFTTGVFFIDAAIAAVLFTQVIRSKEETLQF